VARVEAADSPPVYYLLDLAKNQADTIGEEYPQLPAAALGKRQEISYRNRAGTETSAFLTLPPQYQDGKPLPLVVLAGGDARVASDAAFDHWSQFLATRGYAVLELDLRTATPEDVADGIGELGKRSLVDHRRVCIVGRQRGGYTALASAAFLPDQFTCAASINGFSELPGQPSPVRSASRIRAEVLLIHSVDNPLVPVAQAHAMMDALRSAHVKHDYHEIKGTDDWLPVTAVRAFVLQSLEKFLAGNLADRS
jgi:dipeptidyl aminopeptidase/acylaminoacyl peptidase